MTPGSQAPIFRETTIINDPRKCGCIFRNNGLHIFFVKEQFYTSIDSYVVMYVCMYVCMYVYMYVCMSACPSVRSSVCLSVCMYNDDTYMYTLWIAIKSQIGVIPVDLGTYIAWIGERTSIQCALPVVSWLINPVDHRYTWVSKTIVVEIQYQLSVSKAIYSKSMRIEQSTYGWFHYCFTNIIQRLHGLPTNRIVSIVWIPVLTKFSMALRLGKRPVPLLGFIWGVHNTRHLPQWNTECPSSSRVSFRDYI